jgi:hypothetical protein
MEGILIFIILQILKLNLRTEKQNCKTVVTYVTSLGERTMGDPLWCLMWL